MAIARQLRYHGFECQLTIWLGQSLILHLGISIAGECCYIFGPFFLSLTFTRKNSLEKIIRVSF